MPDKNAQLVIDSSKTIDLPVYTATKGPDVIDVRGLTAEGVFTYDPGFMSTAACESKITFIDGGKGVLLHRGYPIEQLADESDFLETCYLLLYGELPTQQQQSDFNEAINSSRTVDDSIAEFFKGFTQKAHPMAMMCGVVGAMSALYHEGLDINNEEHRKNTAIELIAKIPTLAAMCYKHSQGEAFVAPNADLSYSENFLHMMFGTAGEAPDVNPILAKAMDRFFILHGDHEQNASTSTVRLAGSSGANPYACIAAGITALWGPAHGGANEAVLKMLNEIGDVSQIDEYVNKAKDKDDPFRLMGFGHRVYKSFDPRAKVMKQCCDEVLAQLGLEDDPLLDIAKKLEKIALEDEYFIEKNLYPNVDFYSGIILKAMGIPVEMFTVMFATGRTPGWIAHWHEMLSAPYKIGRPRQLYTGYSKRNFVKASDR